MDKPAPPTAGPSTAEALFSDAGRTAFQRGFAGLSDAAWCQVMARSINEPVIAGVSFPRFPDASVQNHVHGGSGASAMEEAALFFAFVKHHSYRTGAAAAGKRLLDFGCGWGRMVRMFLRDFDASGLYGFEPAFGLCGVARQLNPQVAVLTGGHVPDGALPAAMFDFVVSWSVFSHLSPGSAASWLGALAAAMAPEGRLVLTVWGARFLRRLLAEERQRAAGAEIHWYSTVVIEAAGSIEARLAAYEAGEFVWFTGGGSTLYGEAFLGRQAMERLITAHRLPFEIEVFDDHSLAQDAFVLRRL